MKKKALFPIILLLLAISLNLPKEIFITLKNTSFGKPVMS